MYKFKITIDKFIKMFGCYGIVRLVFYPFTVLVTTPIRLIQTLIQCRVLLDGKWSEYSHFNPSAGINSLFYWKAAINLDRFGRNGISPYLGIGNYPMSKFFMYTLPSLYMYWRCGTVTLLIGMFGWLFSHLIWYPYINDAWVFIILFITGISTTFYANTFGLQNYNVIGWMFFPIGIFGVVTGNWLIASIAWMLVSFGSFTAVILAVYITIILSIIHINIFPLLTVIPALLKVSTHFFSMLHHGKILKSLQDISKAIGAQDRDVKYRRMSKRMDIAKYYYLLIYSQYIIISTIVSGSVDYILLSSILLFIVNSRFIRFADDQSIFMMILSLAIVNIINTQDYLLLASFWVLASPLPFFAGFPAIKRVLDVVPKLRPFSVRRLIDGMSQFLSPVHKDERVMMAFADPNGQYEKVFDGYRVLTQLPLFIASQNLFHLFPGFWSVFELNYSSAPEIWGRDVESVKKNAAYWNAKYVLIYDNKNYSLSDEWENNGFEIINKFSWNDYKYDLWDIKIYSGDTPDWWLLRVPVINA